MYPGTFAATTPDKPAAVLASTGAQLTYAELDQRSTRLARVLADAGLRPGDVVAMLSPNALTCFEIYWAALRSGLYITAINSHLSADEAAYIIDDSGAAALVVSGSAAAVGSTRALAEQVVPLTPGVRLRLSFDGPVPGYASYDDALAGTTAEPLESQPRGADMLYSSGTTGRPKGIRAPLPERQVDEPGDTMLMVFAPMYGMTADTVYLSPAPIYHAAPLRFCGMIQSVGGTVIMMERFDAEAALAAIERYHVTHSQWVPTMFVRMLKLPVEARDRYDTSSLQVAVHAAAPCPVEVKQAMIAWWGPVLQEYYASTEGAGVTLITSEQWLEHPGSVGRPALGTIHITGDDGEDLPAGQVGTIYFEREIVPFGYHNDPAKTRAGQHPDHQTWSTMGDVGYLDDDGWLFLTDRKAFMIIAGGVNIYPQEVEDVLALHPAVFDVAVIGVPDEDLGEAVRAVVQPAADAVAGPELERELLDFVRGKMARYKTPRQVDFVSELPRTPTGKLVKGKLRAQYWPASAPR